MKILLFHINIFKQSSIIQLCRDLGYDVYTGREEDLTKTIGQIAGLFRSPAKQGNAVPFTDEMMVFCGVKPGELDRFLEEYRNRAIQPVPLKAVMTQYNAQWTPGRLCMELQKEQDYIQPKRN